MVAALIWLAFGPQAKGQERRLWAQRAMESYLAIEDTGSLGWTFPGSRHAFLIQPDSAVRTEALTLFTLLEQPKSDATVRDLAKLLGVPGPKAAPRSYSRAGIVPQPFPRGLNGPVRDGRHLSQH